MSTIKHIRTKVFRCTQAEFAAIAGVTQATVSRWENGAAPSLEEMAAIRVAAKGKRGWNDRLFFEAPSQDERATA